MNSQLFLQTKTNLNVPPESDEIEITLLGAGFGECIVIHTGQGEWHIVDSCRFKNIKEPGALHYLKQIQVDYEKNVATIVATHWDDDHIRGIGEIVTQCTNSKFIMSAALKDKKFIKIVVDPDSPLFQQITLGQKASTGVSEFSKILHHLKKINKKAAYALEDRCLWKSSIQENTQLFALSPHDEVFEKAIHSILSQIPLNGNPVASLMPVKPNFTSIVLWVKIGDERFLLGADMEEHFSFPGWSRIVANEISIDGRAGVYKVAHHGSSTGDHDEIWSRLLINNPVCLIAPWTRGGKVLPSEMDLDRILTKSQSIYLTHNSEDKTKTKLETKHVKRAMAQINARPLLNDFGMVRLRKKIGEPNWRPEFFGTAYNASIKDVLT